MTKVSDALRVLLIRALSKEAEWDGSGAATNEAAALHDFLQEDPEKRGERGVQWVLHRGH